jgi:hypothetical protein
MRPFVSATFMLQYSFISATLNPLCLTRGLNLDRLHYLLDILWKIHFIIWWAMIFDTVSEAPLNINMDPILVEIRLSIGLNRAILLHTIARFKQLKLLGKVSLLRALFELRSYHRWLWGTDLWCLLLLHDYGSLCIIERFLLPHVVWVVGSYPLKPPIERGLASVVPSVNLGCWVEWVLSNLAILLDAYLWSVVDAFESVIHKGVYFHDGSVRLQIVKEDWSIARSKP